jgi:hypothetical protein
VSRLCRGGWERACGRVTATPLGESVTDASWAVQEGTGAIIPFTLSRCDVNFERLTPLLMEMSALEKNRSFWGHRQGKKTGWRGILLEQYQCRKRKQKCQSREEWLMLSYHTCPPGGHVLEMWSWWCHTRSPHVLRLPYNAMIMTAEVRIYNTTENANGLVAPPPRQHTPSSIRQP